MAEYRSMTLGECARFDKENGLAQRITGWGKICKLRANENSKSQRRKRNEKPKKKDY